MIHPFTDYDEEILTTALVMSEEPRLNPLPSNIILNKVLTGWGATYSELKATRHSIIILPHKSQIMNKLNSPNHKHDFLIAVKEDVSQAEIIKRMSTRGERYVKFLCTPESLYKVINSLFRCAINPYIEYFCFWDEFHKIRSDIGYRVNMSSFITRFFRFTNKSMVSATPFMPIDPRFGTFKKWKVIHQREIKKDITLLLVNNLASAFKEYIDNFEGERLFVFFNSLNGIKSFIDLCGLNDHSHIYCSEDGVKQFNNKGTYKAFKEIDSSKIAKYNFLTSSFFNGLDISLTGEIPHVLIVTDIKYADYTVANPNTEIYQILGRFRPEDYKLDHKDRIASATHLVNIKNNGIVKTQGRSVRDFNVSMLHYNTISDLHKATLDPFLKQFYKEGKLRIKPYANLLTNDKLDLFKVDNYLYENKLVECYGHSIALPLAYEFSQLFNVTQINKEYTPEEFASMTKGMRRYSKENIKKCIALYTEALEESNEESLRILMAELKKSFPLIHDAIIELGVEFIIDCQFSASKIKLALLKKDIEAKRNHHAVFEAVYQKFRVGISYPVSKVKQTLQEIFDEFEIEIIAKATYISSYFKVSEFTGHLALSKKEMMEGQKAMSAEQLENGEAVQTTKSVKMYRITERKYNILDKHSNRAKPSVS
jgi:hypothetical protein